MDTTIPYICVGAGSGTDYLKWFWGRRTENKVQIGTYYALQDPYNDNLEIKKETSGLNWKRECLKKSNGKDERDHWPGCLIPAYLYFTKTPSNNDDVMVGSRLRNLGKTNAVCEDECIWGDTSATLQEVCMAGMGYTTCSGGKWTAPIFFQPYTKKWSAVKLTDLVVVGVMSDQWRPGEIAKGNSPVVKNILPNWGTITPFKQEIINHFVTKKVPGGHDYEYMVAYAYLGYPTQKLTDKERVQCCMGRPSGTISEAVCRFYNIMGKCVRCDIFMYDLCRDVDKVKKLGINPNYCACINSEVPQAHCFDVTCSNEGYKFTTMDTPCTGAYVKCDQFNQFEGNEDLNLDTVAIKQICPGFGAPQTEDATPELLDPDIPPIIIGTPKEEIKKEVIRDTGTETTSGTTGEVKKKEETLKETTPETTTETTTEEVATEASSNYLFYDGGKLFGDDTHSAIQKLGLSDTEFILFAIIIFVLLYNYFIKKNMQMGMPGMGNQMGMPGYGASMGMGAPRMY